MNLQRISAWLAIVMCIVGAPLKVVRALRQPEPFAFVAYDYIALGLLLAGAIIALRKGPALWLAAGWGFGCAMFYGSFTSHYWALTHAAADLRFEKTMVVSTALFLALNVVGLVLCVAPARGQARGHKRVAGA